MSTRSRDLDNAKSLQDNNHCISNKMYEALKALSLEIWAECLNVTCHCGLIAVIMLWLYFQCFDLLFWLI